MKTTLNKKTLLLEAQQQKDALKRLQSWLRNAMLLSSCAAVLAWWGLAGSGLCMACGVAGIVLASVSMICAALIGLGIRNGRRNVAHILKAVEQA